MLFLIVLASIVGVPVVFSATAIATPSGEQTPGTATAGDRLVDKISPELKSIIAMAPVTLDTSDDPFYSEVVSKKAASYLSERLSVGMLSGSGEMSLPNSTSMLNFTTTGTEIIDAKTSAVVSNETITLVSGDENAQVSMFQIAHYRSDDGIQRKAVIAVFATNSTGELAALDGKVGLGESELTDAGDLQIKLWPLN